MADLDELDTAILRELQADARRTNRDIAAAVGVAPTTALDRTRSLRQRGIIRGALLDLDLAAIGRPVQALIAIRIRPPKRQVLEAFRDWAARLPQTLGLFVVTGNEDFLLHIAVADNQDLYAFVIDHLTQRPEVADVRTSVVYEHIRNPYIAPAPLPRRRLSVRCCRNLIPGGNAAVVYMSHDVLSDVADAAYGRRRLRAERP